MRFGEFVEINPKIKIQKGQEYPFVEMDAVEPTRRYVQAKQSREFGGGGSKFRVRDTLFARITPCLENGKIAQFIDEEYEVGFGSTEFIVFRAKQGISDTSFVYYLARTHTIRGPAEKSMSGASGRQRADAEVIGNIEIEVPSLDVQQKIAAILSTYDDVIENNLRRIKILEEMAQTLYREWFVKFRFPGHQNIKMVDSPLGKIPEGWEVKLLKEICESVNYGYTASARQKAVGPKFLRITDVVPYLIDWLSVPYCEISEKEFPKYLLKEGDIVIARTGATTGYAKQINKVHPESVFASYLVRIRINPYYGRLHIGLLIESDEYKRFIKTNLGGAAQPQANAQVLTSFPILIPAQNLLNSFESFLRNVSDQRDILHHKNMNLRQTRDLLLPKLISGELDVSELDIRIPEADA